MICRDYAQSHLLAIAAKAAKPAIHLKKKPGYKIFIFYI